MLSVFLPVGRARASIPSVTGTLEGVTACMHISAARDLLYKVFKLRHLCYNREETVVKAALSKYSTSVAIIFFLDSLLNYNSPFIFCSRLSLC